MSAHDAARKLVDAFDLVSTAYHEAGHAKVAEHYGISTQVRLWTTGTEDPASHKLYNGATVVHGDLGSHARAVALAGPLASILAGEPGISPEKALQALQGLPLSDTDREQAGAFSVEDVGETLSVLRSLWPEVEREASSLIRSKVAR